MKAPMAILRGSIYFTEHISQSNTGITSTFWFETGKWYKANKCINLKWDVKELTDNGYHYVPSQDIIEMREHLRDYFGARS
jgi:hypothetical protein